jgi:hypothetical protein
MTLTKTTKVWLVGVTQTAPGSAGLIGLIADTNPGAKVIGVASSSKFSVASIPITVVAGNPVLCEGRRIPTGPWRFLWGAGYPFAVISDSGSLADLDQVQMSENLIYQRGATGIFARDVAPGIKWGPVRGVRADFNGRYLDAAPGTPLADLVDFLQGRIRDAKKYSKLVVQQSFIFSDARTGVPKNPDGSKAMTVMNSGFEVDEEAFRSRSSGRYYVFVTRFAKAELGAQPGQNASDGELVAAKVG